MGVRTECGVVGVWVKNRDREKRKDGEGRGEISSESITD